MRGGTYRCAEGHSLRVDDIVGGKFDGFGIEGVEEGFDEADFCHFGVGLIRIEDD